jgi:hypothetical protein
MLRLFFSCLCLFAAAAHAAPLPAELEQRIGREVEAELREGGVPGAARAAYLHPDLLTTARTKGR